MEDVDGFHACLDTVARERKHLAFVEGPSLDRIRTFVESNLENDVAQSVASDAGKIVGWCDVVPLSSIGMTHSGTLGMGLLATHRGQGLGRRLLELTIQQANEFGLSRIELEVFASNTPAVSLYQRTGFQNEGIKRQARILDDRIDDVICMARLF